MLKFQNKTIYQALGREPVHPFPARMAPGIVLDILSKSTKPLNVLDPMVGSGTVLAVANSKGHATTGFDLDPLAVLISKVWITPVNKNSVIKEANKILELSKNLFSNSKPNQSFPTDADEETRKFISYWFDMNSRKQLTALSSLISEVRNSTVRNVLWCAFSRMIITKKSGVSLAMDLSHSRPHKKYKKSPIKPFDVFISSVQRVVNNCLENEINGKNTTSIKLGDARLLPLKKASIDLVLTSPPYLNAIDYIRCSKFSLVWMGYKTSEMRTLRAFSVGAEARRKEIMNDEKIKNVIMILKLKPKLNSRDEAILYRYIDDMYNSVKEVSRVLVSGGKAVYVIGENTIKGTYIRNSLILTNVAKSLGLELSDRQARILPPNRRYLPPPSKHGKSPSMDVRMRREIILTFIKSSA